MSVKCWSITYICNTIFIKIVIFSILLMYLYLLLKNQSSFDTSIRSVAFNVISILTGTGYVTQNFSDWGQFPLIYFLILMFIGGCAGSTACGIKIFRVQILFQFIAVQLKKIIYPRGIFKIKYESNNIDEKFLASIISSRATRSCFQNAAPLEVYMAPSSVPDGWLDFHGSVASHILQPPLGRL